MSGGVKEGPVVVDGTQYCRWSRKIFEEMREGGVTAVHATIAYHENFRETVDRIGEWNDLFRLNGDLVFHGRTAGDVELARATGRTAIFFGSQNPSVIESDIGLVEVLHALGLRFMQLSYNNQSLLCTGWWEAEDTGLTRMGREVLREMNRLGIVIDMSHSGERSTLEAIELSSRPIAVTHANPSSWRPTGRNKSDAVLRALTQAKGMLGLSLYPHHLKDGSACTLESFATMAARLAEILGPEHIGIGSDLCQDQPHSVVAWMRNGRWTRAGTDLGTPAVFPPQPPWFQDNRDFGAIAGGLVSVGFSHAEVAGIMGENWLRFFREAFAPEPAGRDNTADMEFAR
jgi:microsomal dipeptidase-like Zn-dependent dipeptidase